MGAHGAPARGSSALIPYWLLWGYFFAGLSLSRREVQPGQTAGLSGLAILGLIGMTLMIGLRFEVGGDWGAYKRMFSWSSTATLAEVLGRGDPGYFFFNWLAHQFGAGVWLVNLVCGAIVVTGVAALARREPQPWLAILLAIPYLIVVVAMGYTRQAAALGLVMVGLAGLLEGKSVLRFLLWILVAALFHKTAVVCLPFIAFVGERSRFVNLALLGSAAIALYFLFLRDSLDTLVNAYVETRYASSGAAIRISMSLLPAVLFLLFRDRLGFTRIESQLWRNFSIVSLGAAVALLISPSSTAVDRVALYLLPLQFVVLAGIPGRLVGISFGNVLLAGYSAAVLFTWLNYAVHAEVWVPYGWWPAQ
jgi:hypothetical protein